jgi:NitT/TauT family transport system ATP-binding protein
LRSSRVVAAGLPKLNDRPGGTGTAVAISDAQVVFGDHCVLDHINLQVQEGEVVALIGPSGCGKSTLLNLVAGLVLPTSGAVQCLGKAVSGLNRNVGYMTQKDTLLPWRSAVDNVALPLEIGGVRKAERRGRALAEMERLRIAGAANLRPHQLSGGMRSRVSMARTLLGGSRVILLDEPFAALDALLRLRLGQMLVDIWADTHVTMLYVTHDLIEAISLAHRVVVLGKGHILAERRVDEPHPRDVARFRATAVAQGLYAELWDLLDQESTGGPDK